MALSGSAIQSLREALVSSTVYTPGQDGYREALTRWSDTGIKQAGIVVQPADANDVRTLLLWAQQQDIDLAVKCGGHSVSGTSSSEGGLVIDLSRMKNVRVNLADKTVTVGGGATWRDVDEAAAEYGLAAVGGTVNHTGVGGLTLGGGYGWLSGMYGLTIDNLLAATVVLANGDVVTTSATENPDLFWGLRGAGYNFGVVVEFTYQAYEQKEPVYAGILAFTPDKVEAVVEVLNKLLLDTPDPRAGAMCIFAQPRGAPVPMANLVIFFNGAHEEGEKHFAALLALGPVVNTAGMMPYSQVNALQNPMATYGDRKSFKGVFFHPPLSPAFARTMLDDFTAKVQEDPDLGASALLLEFYDMGKVCEVPRNSMAFASRGSTQNGIITLRWTDASKDQQNRAWAREMQARWKQNLEGSVTPELKPEVPQYINYAEPGDSVVINIYGENLAKLQELKAKYDPKNVFCKMHPIKFSD
ncbi:FAD binding domain protein [Aspergillus rambellii]|uniref:FAD binding domain protein n=1 Tax=Aspergillus rambellii TaxID=308745 RepID=A0A0F8U5L8_9EURO|nr:FAD binding domain protein [Aspergillus rambellii]